MDRTERFYKIEMLIRSRRPESGYVSFLELMDELGVSRATLRRDLEYLRDRMDAPIVYDRYLNGYKFDERQGSKGHATHELPGVWFSEREIHALLTMHQLIQDLDEGGVLARHLHPLLEKLHGMLGTSESEAKALMKRVKIISAAKRPVPSKFFESIGAAVIKRRRVQLRYRSRGRKADGDREVSPQRLVHYRNTWYLDAWCHQADALRRFSLDAIKTAQLLETRAKDVSVKALEAEFDGGYGAFSGAKLQWASLRFDPEVAEWVSREIWHPDQKGARLDDGSYRLAVPYAVPTELALDIMRHADHVTVEAPKVLAELVSSKVAAAQAKLRREG